MYVATLRFLQHLKGAEAHEMHEGQRAVRESRARRMRSKQAKRRWREREFCLLLDRTSMSLSRCQEECARRGIVGPLSFGAVGGGSSVSSNRGRAAAALAMATA